MSTEKDIIKKLFQQEFSKMVAVMSHLFGLDNIELAEDIVSETFLLANENWSQKGLPSNPTAWLYKVAKRKTIHHFRRNKIFNKIGIEIKKTGSNREEFPEFDFSQQHIRDSQLQMMFAICNPLIAGEAQMGLALRILCGFSIEEIAEAFLSNKETISKRLQRAKDKIRSENIRLELPSEDELSRRLQNVLHILYLLFNEGYYSTTQNEVLRKDLCMEAMRLTLSLTEWQKSNLPQTHALLSLMCFHASRFHARAGLEASVLYDEQDKEMWDQELIKKGWHFLSLSAKGNTLSSYHLEARIASWHCIKDESKEKWDDVFQLYDQLLTINLSPGVVLNRAFALYKAKGWKASLATVEQLNMTNNHFYFVLLGELYRNFDFEGAILHYKTAYQLAKSPAQKQIIQRKIQSLTKVN